MPHNEHISRERYEKWALFGGAFGEVHGNCAKGVRIIGGGPQLFVCCDSCVTAMTLDAVSAGLEIPTAVECTLKRGEEKEIEVV